MPRAYKSKSFKRRRSRKSGRYGAISKARSRSYKKRRRGTTTLLRGPVNTRALAKFKYVEDVTLPATVSGSIGTYTFIANGMYDPNLTGTGHQPMGFDQLMAQYNHYTVLGAKIVMVPNFTSSGSDAMCGINLSGNATFPFISQTQIIESKRRNYRRLPKDSHALLPSVSYKFSAKKFFTAKNLLGEDSYKGSDSTNPIEKAYFHLFHASLSGVSLGTLNYRVHISYMCMFHEPKAIMQS